MRKFLYYSQHGIALLCMVIATRMIQWFTQRLYLPDASEQGLFSLIALLWQSADPFLRLIVLINFIVKPLFVYCAVLFAFWFRKNCE